MVRITRLVLRKGDVRKELVIKRKLKKNRINEYWKKSHKKINFNRINIWGERVDISTIFFDYKEGQWIELEEKIFYKNEEVNNINNKLDIKFFNTVNLNLYINKLDLFINNISNNKDIVKFLKYSEGKKRLENKNNEYRNENNKLENENKELENENNKLENENNKLENENIELLKKKDFNKIGENKNKIEENLSKIGENKYKIEENNNKKKENKKEIRIIKNKINASKNNEPIKEYKILIDTREKLGKMESKNHLGLIMYNKELDFYAINTFTSTDKKELYLKRGNQLLNISSLKLEDYENNLLLKELEKLINLDYKIIEDKDTINWYISDINTTKKEVIENIEEMRNLLCYLLENKKIILINEKNNYMDFKFRNFNVINNSLDIIKNFKLIYKEQFISKNDYEIICNNESKNKIYYLNLINYGIELNKISGVLKYYENINEIILYFWILYVYNNQYKVLEDKENIEIVDISIEEEKTNIKSEETLNDKNMKEDEEEPIKYKSYSQQYIQEKLWKNEIGKEKLKEVKNLNKEKTQTEVLKEEKTVAINLTERLNELKKDVKKPELQKNMLKDTEILEQREIESDTERLIQSEMDYDAERLKDIETASKNVSKVKDKEPPTKE